MMHELCFESSSERHLPCNMHAFDEGSAQIESFPARPAIQDCCFIHVALQYCNIILTQN